MALRKRTRDTGTADAGRLSERRRAGVIGVLLLTGIVGLHGCQVLSPVEGSGPSFDNGRFMEAWETYLHCRSSTEPEEVHTDLHWLKMLAQTMTVQNDSPAHVPAVIRPLITALPSRLAVDPGAMVIACALHGEHVVQSSKEPKMISIGYLDRAPR